MIFKPHPLSSRHLDKQELERDRKSCRRSGPCGVGEKALYLNSFFIDRYYYVPFASVERVFKRVAMSKGGFSGKGMFASMPYLVVEYDGGRQKQCNFKHENHVDEILETLSREQPQIKLMSRSAEAKIARQKEELDEELRSRPELTEGAVTEIDELQ